MGSRFCARWSSTPDRDTDGMPPVGSPLDVWAAWYRACGCELCRSVWELTAMPRVPVRVGGCVVVTIPTGSIFGIAVLALVVGIISGRSSRVMDRIGRAHAAVSRWSCDGR